MRKVLSYMAAALLLMGCSADLLNIDNPNEATSTTFWRTEADAVAGVNACYSNLYKEATWMRWLSFRYDLTSDEGNSLSPWLELAQWCRFEYNNYNFWEGNTQHWETFYRGIFRANQVLKFVPDIEMDAIRKDYILGQAAFFRALWYFQINLIWEKGALVLEPVDAGYEPEDASEAQIWEQIEADLLYAADRLPESWSGADGGRATKGAAKALLGKAYMQQHRYADALEQFRYLIESPLYGLIDNWEDNFTNRNELNEEGIFEIQFDGTNKGGTGNDANMATGFQRTQFFAAGGVGWGDGMANHWLVDEWLKEKRVDGANDIRCLVSVLYPTVGDDFPDDPRAKRYYNTIDIVNEYQHNDNWNKGNAWTDGMCFIRKYSTEYQRNQEDYFADNNYRILRYADILLNYAECIAETGGSITDAAGYVDQVRERVGLHKLSESIYADCLSSRETFLKRIQVERPLELCFEGWRWADLKRWGLLSTQGGIDELRSRDPEFNNFVLGKHHRQPLPQTEVDNSGGKLTQHAEYR